MGTRFLLALFLVLLLVGLEVQAAQEDQEDQPASPALFSQVQESLSQYWTSAKTTALSLYEKTYLPAVDEKIRDIYSKSTAAVTTYAGILTDQILTLLKGDQ